MKISWTLLFLLRFIKCSELIGIIKKYINPEITIALNVYIKINPKYNTTPNNKKMVIFLGTEILLKEYVGSLLINNIETNTNKIGTIKS